MKKVLLIGWDAADWKVMTPLIDEGKMPNLEKFVNQGVMGDLATLSPSLSPMLWTSIATGKRPIKHGIHGFIEPNPHAAGIRPITNLSRNTRAIWNIMNLNGMKSNVVGWWPSHPAEHINGVMVSNFFNKAGRPLDKPWPVTPGSVHPPELAEKISLYRVHPQELSGEHIGPFVPDFGKVDQDKDHRLSGLAKIIAESATVHAVSTAIMQLEPWDFMAVYYDAIDHFCHGFMRYHPPKMKNVSQEDFERYKGVVEGGYRYHDMMLGALLSLAGEDTTVILVSDHGFHPDHLRPLSIPVEPAGPAVQHRSHGVFIMKGPGIIQDERIYGASLLDITPTILTIYGLPVGKDMDGMPLVEAFEDKQKRNIKFINSWDDEAGDDGAHPPGAAINAEDAQAAIDQLVDLGYIEKPSDDVEKAVKEATRELRYNLARSYMDAGRYNDAITYLEDLRAVWPNEYRFSENLVQSYNAAGQNQKARKELEDLIKRKHSDSMTAVKELKKWQKSHKDTKPDDLDEKEKKDILNLRKRAGINSFALEGMMGRQCLAEQDYKQALAHFNRCEELDDNNPAIYIMKGQALLALKMADEAEKCFQKAIKIDPSNPRGHIGASQVYLNRRQNLLAASAALSALGLGYDNHLAHYLLGVAWHRAGRILPAIQALKFALLLRPNMVAALKRLEHIYRKRLKNDEEADYYEELTKAAQQRIKDVKNGTIDDVLQNKATAVTSVHSVFESSEETLQVPLDEVITIVSGIPRSGTSMMMQMLEAGGLTVFQDGARTADKHNKKGYFEETRVKSLRRDVSWIESAKGKCIKIIAPLLTFLPVNRKFSYAVIFMERDSEEVILSQKDLLKDKGKQGADISDDRLLKTYNQQVGHSKERMSVLKIPFICVNYNDCIQNPKDEAVRVNAFLGGELNERSMAEAVDKSLYQHRK